MVMNGGKRVEEIESVSRKGYLHEMISLLSHLLLMKKLLPGKQIISKVAP